MFVQRRRIYKTVFLAAFFASICSPVWAANSYYVFDGSSLRAAIGNPGDVHADQWAAFYFKKGASTSELSQRWGMDLQDSPEAALQSVESNQKFERTYEKWCGCAWGQDTFFNSVAPVAMVKEASAFSPKQVQLLAHLHAGWDRVQGLISRFNTAADLAGEQKLPRLGSGGPFSDFMSAMHTVIDQAMSIGSQVTRQSDAAMAVLDSKLAEFDKTVARATVDDVEGQLRTLGGATSGIQPISKVSVYVDDANRTWEVQGSSVIETFQVPGGNYGQGRIALSDVDLSDVNSFPSSRAGVGGLVFLSCVRGNCVNETVVNKFTGQQQATSDQMSVYCPTTDECDGFLEAVRRAGNYRPKAEVARTPSTSAGVARGAGPTTGSTSTTRPSASPTSESISEQRSTTKAPTGPPTSPATEVDIPVMMEELKVPLSRLGSAVSNVASNRSGNAAAELNSAVNQLLEAATKSPGPLGSTTWVRCNPQCSVAVNMMVAPTDTPARIEVSVNAGDMTMSASRTLGGNGGPQTSTSTLSMSGGGNAVVANGNAVTTDPSGASACGTVDSTFRQSVLVLDGQTCVLTRDTVYGAIKVTRGSLMLRETSVYGPVQVDGGGTVSICGSRIEGPVTIANNRASVELGSDRCAGNTISGILQLQNNTGTVRVFNNTVRGIMQCQNNSSLSGNGNTVSLTQGQCPGF